MEQVILVIYVLLAAAMVGLILLQQGKGADAGASGADASGASGAAAGAAAAARLRQRIHRLAQRRRQRPHWRLFLGQRRVPGT